MQEVTSLRIQQMKESATLAMAARSRELKSQGKDIISLSLGEPDFNTPEFVKEAAKKAVDADYSHYTPVNGLLELREAISTKFKRDNNLNYSTDQIVVSTGAKQSLSNVVMALVNPGDEVLLPAPYWVSYEAMAELAEGTVIPVATDITTDFKINAEILEKHITPKTKLLIFSSPCNPSGSVYTKAELEAIAKVIEKNPQLYVIADEIYEYINFTDERFSLGSIESIYNQVITVNGVSKGYAMTGYRIGYIGAPLWIAKACTKIQGQITSGTCAVAQMAAKAACEADPSVLNDMLDTYKSRRDLVIGLLQKAKDIKLNTPNGAFYVYPDVSNYFGRSYNGTTINNASDLSLYLLEEAEVATVTGEAFGSKENIRISYATSNEILTDACTRIVNALDKLQ